MALLRNGQIDHRNKLGGLQIDQDILDKDGISARWENVINKCTSSYSICKNKFQVNELNRKDKN